MSSVQVFWLFKTFSEENRLKTDQQSGRFWLMNWDWEKSARKRFQKSFRRQKVHLKGKVPWLFGMDWNWSAFSGTCLYWWKDFGFWVRSGQKKQERESRRPKAQKIFYTTRSNRQSTFLLRGSWKWINRVRPKKLVLNHSNFISSSLANKNILVAFQPPWVLLTSSFSREWKIISIVLRYSKIFERP